MTLRNYKSIAACQVALGPLMFLVGPNGSGKSNFLDALRFVADALRASLDHALRDRGTIKEVRRRSGGHPNHFALRFDFVLPNGQTGYYSFRVGAVRAGGYEVQQEECRVDRSGALDGSAFFKVESGNVVTASFSLRPAALPDRLFLVAASGIPEFRPVFDALSRIEVYNLSSNLRIFGGWTIISSPRGYPQGQMAGLADPSQALASPRDFWMSRQWSDKEVIPGGPINRAWRLDAQSPKMRKVELRMHVM